MKHKTEIIISAIMTLITLAIFLPNGFILESILYALIIGASTYLMCYVLKFGVIWFVEAVKEKLNR